MSAKSEQKMIIAHRGAPSLAPELTMPSFKIALDTGASFIETDVQRSSDGILINFHDDDLKRTTNIREVFPERVNDPVGSFTFKELLRLDAGKWFNKKNPGRARKKYIGVKIPTFEEYLDLFQQGMKACPVIELKKPEKYPGIEDQIISILREKGFIYEEIISIEDRRNNDTKKIGKNKRAILISFNEDSLLNIKKINPGAEIFFIGNIHTLKRLGGYENYLITAENLEGGICMAGTIATPARIKKAHGHGINIFIYTINSKILKNFYFKSHVMGIITNKCEKFCKN